jgi:hypothetical protein
VTEPISIALTNPDGTDIRLGFQRVFDRWAHGWYSLDPDQPVAWMQSVEGTPDQDWPPSPPLQELNQLQLEPGNSVLGVGMAGHSHWSASYSIEQAPDGSTSVKSDLACLQKKPITAPATASSLGSTYEFSQNCVIQSDHETRIELVIPNSQRIVLEAMEDDNCATVFRVQGRTLSVVPRRISPSPVQASRWAFLVKVSG